MQQENQVRNTHWETTEIRDNEKSEVSFIQEQLVWDHYLS